MLATHAIRGFLAVDGTSVCLTCEAGYQAPVSDGGRLPQRNLFQCGPALTEEAI